MFRLFSRLIVSSVLFPVATLNLFAQSVTNSVPELDYAKNPNHDLVHEVLNDKCFKCHGCNGADKGKFGSILEIENLIQKGKIIPGEPERSILYQKVLSDEMPASGDPLSEENKKLIYDWIGSLKPKPSSAKAQIDVAQTAAASSNLPSNDSWEAETLLAVQNDIISTAPELRKWYRYITLSSLPENSTESDLEVYRQAVSKVVNSLSWAKNIYIPEKVDSRGLILKINMLKIGWTRKSWDALQSQNPFTLPNLSQTPELQDAFEVEIGSKIPVARADWFVSNAIRSHIYYQILNLPKTRLELEEQLGVDLKGDREKNKIIRTGLLKSGVSLNNRVIEYHKGNYGSFWLSHDFEDSKGSHFIFSHPLDFSPDGGEVIFQLPNGMQAYALYNKQAELIDTASKKIVLDPSRPENIVEGGISCFSCHSTGLIYQNDRLKTYAESHRNEFSHEDFDKIGILYNNDAIKGHILNDTKTYQEKLSAAKSLNISRDPLELALNKFESVMDFAKSARELGMNEKEFRPLIEKRLSSAPNNATTLNTSHFPLDRAEFQKIYPELLSSSERVGNSASPFSGFEPKLVAETLQKMAPETRLSAFKKNGSFSRDDFLRNADELLVKSEPGKETILEKTDNNRQSDKLLDIHASRVGFWSNTAEGMTGGTPFLFRGGQTRKAEVSEPGFFHNQNFTIEAWVKLEPGFNRDPMAIFSYGAEDLAFFLTPEGNLMLSRNNKISITGNNILVNDLDVHQVVVTKTGSKVIFYVDGRPSSPFEFGDTFIFKGNPAIGDRPDLGFQHHFPGSIYKVELYNRPLSEEEIQRSRENDELLYK